MLSFVILGTVILLEVHAWRIKIKGERCTNPKCSPHSFFLPSYVFPELIHLGGCIFIKGESTCGFHFSVGPVWFWRIFPLRHRCVSFILGPLSCHCLSFWNTFAFLGFQFLSDYPLSMPSKTFSSEKIKGIYSVLQNYLIPAPMNGSQTLILIHFPSLQFEPSHSGFHSEFTQSTRTLVFPPCPGRCQAVESDKPWPARWSLLGLIRLFVNSQVEFLVTSAWHSNFQRKNEGSYFFPPVTLWQINFFFPNLHAGLQV